MGFWSDIFRAANPFAKEDLTSPQARERKAWRAASSIYFLRYVRPKVHNDLRLATAEAAKHMRQPGQHAKAWSQKYGFLKKYSFSFKHEENRAFRETSSLPSDIRQRAEYLASQKSGEFSQQYKPREFAPFQPFSPQFIRKY